MNIPTKQECIGLLKRNNTPQNIIEHCTAVSAFAVSLAEKLERKGIHVNKPLIEAAAMLHDIEKLKPEHAKAGYSLLVSLGYPEIAAVVKTHGLENFTDDSFLPRTIEQKIVFYADKRLHNASIVSLEQRFDYIRKKYNFPEIRQEFDYAENVEKELEQLGARL